ncbi:terminase small subunit [Burkholderia ubonensis]|nr:terminase small subunit [Burkholderia ubonensis]
MALTARKRKFADALMAGRSNKAAAIAAGYSAATASQAGSRLVRAC